MTTADQQALEQLRDRVMQLLERENRAMHTGELAVRLGTVTHQIHTAMHVPLQRGLAWFHSSEGYSLPPRERAPASSERQQAIE